jgi:hypothetical protein
LECVQQAVAAGWNDAQRLEREKDFEPIRDQAPFKKLAQMLKTKDNGKK